MGNLATNFGAASGKLWNNGDLDFDGDVDLNDLGSLATYFGTIFSVRKTQTTATTLLAPPTLARGTRIIPRQTLLA